MSINEGIDISHVIELSFITTDTSSDYTWTIRMKDEYNNIVPDGSYNDISLNITRLKMYHVQE